MSGLSEAMENGCFQILNTWLQSNFHLSNKANCVINFACLDNNHDAISTCQECKYRRTVISI